MPATWRHRLHQPGQNGRNLRRVDDPEKYPYLGPYIRALPIDIGRAIVRRQGSKHNLDPLR